MYRHLSNTVPVAPEVKPERAALFLVPPSSRATHTPRTQKTSLFYRLFARQNSGRTRPLLIVKG